MPNDQPPEDNFDTELEKIRRKSIPDSADRKEDADVLKTQAEAEAIQETVRASKLKRRLAPGLIKIIIRCSIFYLPLPVVLTILNGFHLFGFDVGDSVLVAAYSPLALGAIVAIVKAVLK